MAIANSPLRYPGGKQILAPVLAHLIRINGATGGTYAEPYAGGAGAALSLLFGEHVRRVLINDADPCVYAFWKAVLDQTEPFIELLRKTPATVSEWAKQRKIYQSPKRHSGLRVGFATFFLNRCNRSGIIANAGPIGGRDQTGTWKIDARLNRDELERRIRKISLYRDRIAISNLDALKFLSRDVAPLRSVDRPFVYLDPPYYAKGQNLYLNAYAPGDHAGLARFVKRKANFLWVMSYDNVPQIAKLYKGERQIQFDLDYSARERSVGRELMILKRDLTFPEKWKRRIPKKYISSADGLSIPLSS